MALESELFASAIQEDENSKFALMTSPGAVVLVAMDNKKVIGECYALPLTSKVLKDDIEKEHFKELALRYQNKKAIYLYSLAIKPQYKKTFTVKLLMKSLVKRCMELGYKILLSHTKKHSLLKLNKRFSGKEIETRENWSDTGEDYYLCETQLREIAL